MKVLDHVDYKIVILDDMNEDVSPLEFSEESVIYVALQGYTNFDKLSKERFLVINPESSFINHLMWEGHFDSQEQEQYIEKCCKKFWETGKQMIIEDYDYQEDEPFYDYSK